MQLLIAEKKTEQSEFATDAIAFFKGEGLPGKWTYSSPLFEGDVVNGAAQFIDFTKDPIYYPKRNEEGVIQTNAAELMSLAEYFSILADMGCGDAFDEKIRHLLELVEAGYAPIDLNESFMRTSALKFQAAFPDRELDPLNLNFMTDQIHVPGTPFPVMLGCTITNFGTTESVRQIFRQARSIAEQGNGSFAFTHDTNRNEDSLKRTYTHLKMRIHTLNVLHRMKRDLETENFHPEDYDCNGYWDEDKNTFFIYMYPTRDMTFTIEGEEISLKKGEILPQAPLMKLSSEHMLDLAAMEGFSDHHPTRYDHEDKIALQHVRLG